MSQDISEPDEWEPFRFILVPLAGFLGTIPSNPDSSGRIFGNHQDISEPTRRSLAHMREREREREREYSIPVVDIVETLAFCSLESLDTGWLGTEISTSLP